MGNLIRMDLYRMRKAQIWKVTMIIAAISALAVTPAYWALDLLSRMLGSTASVFPKTAELAGIISTPFPFLNAMLAMLAACAFFYADIEFGYIKNIAGQMPKKGYTVLSKFFAVMVQNLLFMLVGVAGHLLGTLIFQRIVVTESVTHALVVFALKFALMQACCTILLLIATGFRSKSFGSVMAVLMGTGLLSLVYMGIDSGLNQLIKNKGFNLADYMPDQLLAAAEPKPMVALAVSVVTILIFLPLATRVFDRKDVK